MTQEGDGSSVHGYLLMEHYCMPPDTHTHTPRMQSDRTTKLEDWNSLCMVSLHCISCLLSYRGWEWGLISNY